MTVYVWAPLSPAGARELFAAFERPWWVAGGWALDMHLGRETRAHADIDLAFARGDEVALPVLLPEWEICIAHEGGLTPWTGDAPLSMPYHQFWVRRAGAEAWSFEVLLEDHDGPAWQYRRDHRVTIPRSRCCTRRKASRTTGRAWTPQRRDGVRRTPPTSTRHSRRSNRPHERGCAKPSPSPTPITPGSRASNESSPRRPPPDDRRPHPSCKINRDGYRTTAGRSSSTGARGSLTGRWRVRRIDRNNGPETLGAFSLPETAEARRPA